MCSIGAVVLASGESRRFGGGKLLAPYGGKPLIAYALAALPEEAFAKRLVVTRTPAIAALARELGFEAQLHSLPEVSDTIRLGIEAMAGLEGCLFAVGDQPLLQAATVWRMVEAFRQHPGHIIRAGWNGQGGNPVIFPGGCFQALAALPKGRGGSYLISRQQADVIMVEAASPLELTDVDTQADLKALP